MGVMVVKGKQPSPENIQPAKKNPTRRAFFLGLALALAHTDVLQGSGQGELTIDLTQWKLVRVKLGAKAKMVRVDQLFEEL